MKLDFFSNLQNSSFPDNVINWIRLTKVSYPGANVIKIILSVIY
jgi:hypothetical protein